MGEVIRAGVQEITHKDSLSVAYDGVKIIDGARPGSTEFLRGAEMVRTHVWEELNRWRDGDNSTDPEILMGKEDEPFHQFSYWLKAFPYEPQKKNRLDFENKMTAVLVWSVVKGLDEQTNTQGISHYLSALRYISNNRREAKSILQQFRASGVDMYLFSEDERRKHLTELYGEGSSELKQILEIVYAVDTLAGYASWPDISPIIYGNEYDRRKAKIIEEIFSDCAWPLICGTDAGRPCQMSMLNAFWEIIMAGSRNPIYDGQNANWKKLPNDITPQLVDKNSSLTDVYFKKAFYNSISSIAESVISGTHNGIIYLTDHLERYLLEKELWKGEGLTEVEWKRILLEAFRTDPQGIFDLQRPVALVRELEKRRDERAENEEMRKSGISQFQLRTVGSGTALVGLKELGNLVERNGGKIDSVIPIDQLPLRDMTLEPANLQVEKVLRGKDGSVRIQEVQTPSFQNRVGETLINSRSIRTWASRSWAELEKRRLLDWRNKVIPNAVKWDITAGTPPVQPGNWVHFLGTDSIFLLDPRKRAEVIRNSLDIVSEGGFFVLGGSTSDLSENVIEIVGRRINGGFKVSYLRLDGDYQSSSDIFQRESTITFTDNGESVTKEGRNWVSVSRENDLRMLQEIHRGITKRLPAHNPVRTNRTAFYQREYEKDHRRG